MDVCTTEVHISDYGLNKLKGNGLVPALGPLVREQRGDCTVSLSKKKQNPSADIPQTHSLQRSKKKRRK